MFFFVALLQSEQTKSREKLLGMASGLQGSASTDPQAVKQQANVVDSLTAEPTQLTNNALDSGADVVDNIIGGTLTSAPPPASSPAARRGYSARTFHRIHAEP